MMFARFAAAALLTAISVAHADDANRDAAVQRVVHVCASCHGEAGRSTKASIPNLASQVPLYLTNQLKDFRTQTRAESDIQAYMWGVSALLDDSMIEGLAEYYATQTPAPGPGKVGDVKRIATGRKIYDEGIPARGVRACGSCHGAHAQGASVFPRLAGQNAPYVFGQLNVFGTRLRPHGVLMKNETANMSAAEMRAVAEYVQSL
jgi:cytochrome c553